MDRLKQRYAAAKTAVGGWLRAVGDWLSAASGWCGQHRIASIVIGGVGFLLFWQWLLDGWWLVTEGRLQALAAYTELPAKEKVEAFSKLATALGVLVAAPSALLGVGLAFWRTWNQHRDTELATLKLATESELAARKLDAEAFAKAVEQLGHAEIAIRMGAVLALQNLAEASPRRLLGQTLEILCAYVREKRPRTKEADEQPAVPLPTDVKLTLQVVSRLNRLNEDGKIPVDLSSTDLRSADLSYAELKGVNFSSSNLSDTMLWRTNLREAYFFRADLRSANLATANLTRANLRYANLINGTLNAAVLEDSDLEHANLRGGDLRYANLQRTKLCHADLERADLDGANLIDADHWEANLKYANLRGTILEKKLDAGG